MKLQKPYMILALACMAVTACQQEQPQPKTPPVSIAKLEKKLEQARERTEFLEGEIIRLEGEQKEISERLRLNLEAPNVVLHNQLTNAASESTAVLGWLTAAKKAAAAKVEDLDAATEFDNAKARAKECVETEQKLGKFFDDARAKNLLKQEELDAMLIQRDWLLHNRLAMEEILAQDP